MEPGDQVRLSVKDEFRVGKAFNAAKAGSGRSCRLSAWHSTAASAAWPSTSSYRRSCCTGPRGLRDFAGFEADLTGTRAREGMAITKAKDKLRKELGRVHDTGTG